MSLVSLVFSGNAVRISIGCNSIISIFISDDDEKALNSKPPPPLFEQSMYSTSLPIQLEVPQASIILASKTYQPELGV